MKKSILFFLFFIGLIITNNAQVSSVKYLIEYNESTSLYDCKLVIEEGSATTILQRIQFTAQYSIVVPTGAQFSIQERFNPIQNNQNYGGTVISKWQDNSPMISPPSQPQNDFYSIAPVLSPVSSYNNLFAGDTITLFSIFVDVDPSEGVVRPFINGVDPSSIEMPNGGDYRNGFALGSSKNIYNGNVSTWPCDDWEVSLTDQDICKGTCIELIPNMNCTSEDMIYEWSTGENTPTITVCPYNNTIYAVEITNPDQEVVVVSNNVSVSELIVEFTGDDRLCHGETTTVSPNTGGTWTSNDPTVATINANTGVITGIAQGAVSFTFTNGSTGCTGTTSVLIVDPVPSVSSSLDAICMSSTATLSPSTGGTWETMNPEVAILSGNIVSAVSIGEAGFRFTFDATGCTSDILYIDVEEIKTTTLTGPNEICAGGTTTIEPSVGGTWSSDDATIATIDNFGNITGIGAGYARFTFTSASSLCLSEISEPVYVTGAPVVESPLSNACIFETFSLSSESGGTWSSSNNYVATVNAFSGEVTTLNSGNVVFTFTSAETGCSAKTQMITVNPLPFEVVSPQNICVGEIGAISPSLNGTWTSDNSDILEVDQNTGAYTANSAGIANLMFTDNNTGCSSSIEIKVDAKPEVEYTGENEMCIGATATVSPITGGFWSSSDISIMTVDNLGLATAIAEGLAWLQYMDENSGCFSDPIMVTVNKETETMITGAKEICVGGVTSAFPSTGGSWTSSNPVVATIDNSGNITGISEGTTTFAYYKGGCFSYTEEITVLSTLSMNVDTTICQGMNYNGLEESGIYTIDTVDALTGCDITITIDLEVLPLNDPLCTVSIEELPESEVKVYPNPTSDLVFVESESALESISIFTIEYQKVEELTFTNGAKKTQINTDELTNGLYILAIESKGMLTYKKLIIE